LTSCSQGQSASYDVMRPHARHTVSWYDSQARSRLLRAFLRLQNPLDGFPSIVSQSPEEPRRSIAWSRQLLSHISNIGRGITLKLTWWLKAARHSCLISW
jgi:hypothetical protein